MSDVKFNINHYVRVKFTEFGIKEIERKNIRVPKPEPDGYTRIQMWDLMQKFGAYCYNGCAPAFELEIIIEAFDV